MTVEKQGPGTTYKDAGVDFDAAAEAKRRIKNLVAATQGPEVLAGVGGFGGLFQLAGFSEPVLVSGTDNVGTKLKISIAMNSYEGLGEDVVNACLNDIIVCGARPLFFLDYIASGKIDPDVVEALMRGMVKGCHDSGCALIGGETSELPGVFPPGEFDLSGFAVGAVEKSLILDNASIAPGDVLIGIPSSGLHTNGYSLVRHALGLDADPAPLFEYHPELGRTLGEALLEPHMAYYPVVKAAMGDIKGMAHITGGGLYDNIPRSFPDGLGALIDLDTWSTPPIFTLLQELGGIPLGEMYHVYNMGIGMVLICEPSKARQVCDVVHGARPIGEVVIAPSERRVFLKRGVMEWSGGRSAK